jgi:diguanylate cyclase (GGDEF)-like protein
MPTGRPNRKKGLFGWGSLVLSSALFFLFLELSPFQMGKLWKIPFFLHSKSLQVPPLAFYFLSLLCVRFGFEYDRLTRQLHLFLAASLTPVFSYVLYGQQDPFTQSLCFLLSSAFLFVGLIRMFFQKIYLDELSGISNRRALDEKLGSLSGPYSIAMIDIDHFKKFNDNYGHEEGDNVLRFVAQHFKRMTGNRTFRYGGEEFCTVIEGSSAEEAVKLMDEARDALSKIKFTLRARRQDPFSIKGILGRLGIVGSGADKGTPKTVNVTVSIGVAHADPKSGPRKTVHETQSASDKALYSAKEGGRNRVSIA